MGFLKFLEGIRTPFLDWFFSLITHLGDETVFLVVAIFIFWCVSKREGYYVLITGLVGTVINQILKLFFAIPRPWVQDTSFKPVDTAVERATGYSFPSGHTQNATGTFGAIARFCKRWWLRIVFIVLIVLVAFSRMYLGVHTPLDVLTSLGIGAALVFALRPLFSTEERFEKYMSFVVMGSIIAALAFMLYFPIFSDAGHDAANLESAMKNAYTLAGCTIGLALVYFVDSAWTKFDTRASWYAQIIKFVVGLGIVLLIKEGLRSPLEYICNGNIYIARMIRYLLVVVFAGIIWPITFKFFARLKCAPLDRFAEKLAKIFKKRDTDADIDSSENEEAPKKKSKAPTLSRKAILADGSEVYVPRKKKKASWRSKNKKNKKHYR